MMKVSASLLLLLVLLATSCSTPRFAREARFDAQDQANLIVRYYTDDTSYVLKPEAKNGPFMAVLNREAVLEMAKQQAGRHLAVVILIHYGTETEAEAVKCKWRNLLTQVGYERVVFLRGRTGMNVKGLPVLASNS